MTQVALTEKKNYTQIPNILFEKAYEGLSNLERWLTATLLRIGWNWKPDTFYQVSLADISEASGISRGYLCPCNGKTKREGMLFKLQRLGLILIKKAIGKNAPYFLALTSKLWHDNSVYSVNTLKEQKSQGVYSVDSDVYSVDTSIYPVNTSVYSVNTKEAIKPLAERDETPPNTNKTSNTYKTDSSANADGTRDEFPPYADGLKPQGRHLSAWLADITLMDDAFLASLEQQLSTPSYPHVENDSHSHSHSHSHVSAIGDEAAQPPSMQPREHTPMAATEPALQADTRCTKPTSEHATMDSTMLFPASNPVSREASKPASTEETKKRSNRKKAVSLDLLSSASSCAQHIIADWQAIFKAPQPITKLLIEAAEQLAPCNPSAEELRACRLWLYKTDTKSWYRQHGMCLNDIARNWEKWQSAVVAPPVEAVLVGSLSKKYKPLPEEELVEWQGQMMTVLEADKRGFNGGFGAYL